MDRLITQGIESLIKPPAIPNVSTVDPHWLGHSAVRDHLVELADADADVLGSRFSA